MPAIVKANNTLTSGGFAVLRSSLVFNGMDATLEVDACCLPAFYSQYVKRFTKGARAFAGTSPLTGLSLQREPTLYDVNISTENGICYFKAKYSCEIDPTSDASNGRGVNEESDFTFTRSWDIKTFNIGATKQVFQTQTVPGTTNGSTQQVLVSTEYITASFDYVSITESVTQKGRGSAPSVKGSAKEPFNKRNFKALGAVISVNPFKEATVDSGSETTNSRGEIIYTMTSVGIYQES